MKSLPECILIARQIMQIMQINCMPNLIARQNREWLLLIILSLSHTLSILYYVQLLCRGCSIEQIMSCVGKKLSRTMTHV